MESLYSFCRILSCLIVLISPEGIAQTRTPPPVSFEKATIKLGPKILEVEIAETPEQRSRGLMYRTKMGADEGMLFIFDREETLSFWMKNTFIDLSIGFFDKNKTLVDVQEMKKSNSVLDQNLPSYTSARPAMYALEMNKEWFKRNKIMLGTRFEFKELPKSRSKSAGLSDTK